MTHPGRQLPHRKTRPRIVSFAEQILVLLFKLPKNLPGRLSAASAHVINAAVDACDHVDLIFVMQIFVVRIRVDQNHVRLSIDSENNWLPGPLQLPPEFCGVPLKDAQALDVAAKFHIRILPQVAKYSANLASIMLHNLDGDPMPCS